MKRIVFFLIHLIVVVGAKAQFTAGNIAVLRIGDSVATLAATGGNVAIDQLTLAGGYVNTTFMPRGPASNAVCLSGIASSEGLLNLSGNGNALVFGVYRTAAPYTSSLPASLSSAVNRVVVSVNAAGTVSFPTFTASFLSSNNIRYAYTNNGTNFWAGGGNTGIVYGSTTSNLDTLVSNTTVNTRFLTASGGQLYYSTASGGTGIYRLGNGLPTNSGTVGTIYISSVGGSPYGFSMKPDSTVCYIADDRAAASGGGVQKWIRTGSTWSLAYTFVTGVGSLVGARGLAVNWATTPPTIIATTSEPSSNRIIRIIDSNATSTVFILDTAAANTVFRGIAFTPGTNTVPVKWISFTGETRYSSNVLRWVTASELNNAGFEVERSMDGENFKQIAFVKGNGTTSTVSKYEYIDYGASNAYYRLKQVDFDGQFEYSKTVAVKNADMLVELTPNPFTNTIEISSNKNIVSAEIVDITGKTRIAEVINGMNVTINTADLSNGIYFIRINNGETVITKRIIKN